MNTNDLTGKVRAALPLFLNRGEVYLFALFELPDIKGQWEFLISSAQADLSPENEIKFFATEVLPTLNSDEVKSLSRMMPVKSTDPALVALTSAISIEGGTFKVTESNLNGIYVNNAIIFRSISPRAMNVV